MSPPNNNIYYCDSFSILVLNPKGEIRILYAPFRVTCIQSVKGLHQNSIVFVDEVFEDKKQQLLYKINGNIYPYSLFRIDIKF